MKYNKRYSKDIILEQIKKSDKKTFTIEELLFEIEFDMQDINKFYVGHIKHRLRYKDK